MSLAIETINYFFKILLLAINFFRRAFLATITGAIFCCSWTYLEFYKITVSPLGDNLRYLIKNFLPEFQITYGPFLLTLTWYTKFLLLIIQLSLRTSTSVFITAPIYRKIITKRHKARANVKPVIEGCCPIFMTFCI